MTARRPLPLMKLVAAAAVVVGAVGVAAWWLSMRALDRAIDRAHDDVSRQHVIGRVPPTRDVVGYLTERDATLAAHYQAAVAFVLPTLAGPAHHGDAQLYFQQRLHEVQRTLERAATARGMAVPMQLGLPKDIPPLDVVPRLLIQLGVVEETAELFMGVRGVSQISSFKIEDPQALASGSDEDEEDVFLIQLPVRVRLAASLEALSKACDRIQSATPLIDVVSARIRRMADAASPPTLSLAAQELDVELVVARYLVRPPDERLAESEPRRAQAQANE